MTIAQGREPAAVRRARCVRRPSVVVIAAALAFCTTLRCFPQSSAGCSPTGRQAPIEQDPGAPEPISGADPQPIRRTLPQRPCGAEFPTSAAPASIPPAVATVLTGMAAQASVIFIGQVRSIDRQSALGYVDVSFRVGSAVRGTSASVYILREWAGLWTWQQNRYFVGERVLLLLLPRSSSGFSSPVGGVDGAIPLLGGSEPPLLRNGVVPPDGAIGTTDLSVTGMRADLRWIAALALRTRAPNAPSAQTEQQAMEVGVPVSLPPGYPGAPVQWHLPVAPPSPASNATQDAQGVPLSTVLALLSGGDPSNAR